MKRRILAMLAVAVLSAASPLVAAAQNQPGGQGGAPAAPRPAGIDLATARRMMAATEPAATAANARVAIAIVDMNGDLVLFQRMDGASARAVTSSHGKARAALLFGMPTRAVADAVAAGTPVTATITQPIAGAWELTPMQGGLPVLRDGKVVAAIGVGGAAPAMDEQFAQAGISAIGAGR
jgi:glc operon protein GlcG